MLIFNAYLIKCEKLEVVNWEELIQNDKKELTRRIFIKTISD